MKMQVMLGKPQPWVLPVTFVCLALGALVALMLKVSLPESDIDLKNARPEELRTMIRTLQTEKNNLVMENQKLRGDKDAMMNSLADSTKNMKVFKDELDSLRIRAGTTAVEGRGIVITIDDSKSTRPDLSAMDPAAVLTHDVDLLMLVNELRAAGAEAIAINDQRVIFSSAIRCVGPVINVNNHQVGAPFTIQAIGKPENLAGAMNLPFGVLDSLKQLGIKATVVKRDKIHLPAVSLLPPFEETTVVPDEPKKSGRP